MGIKDKSGRYQMRPAALLPKFVSDKNPFGTTPVPEVKPEPKNTPAAVDAPKSEPVATGRRRPQASAANSPVSEPKAQTPKPQAARQMTPSLFDPAPSAAEPLTPYSLDQAIKWEVEEEKNVEVKHGVSLGSQAGANSTIEETSSTPCATGTLPAKAGTPCSSDRQKVIEPNVTRPLPARAKPRAAFGAWVKKLNPLTYLAARTQAAKPIRPRTDRPPVQTELSLERVKVVRNDLSDADLEVIPARPAKPAKVSLPAPQTARVREPVLAGQVREPTAWGRLSSRWFGAGQTTQTH